MGQLVYKINRREITMTSFGHKHEYFEDDDFRTKEKSIYVNWSDCLVIYDSPRSDTADDFISTGIIVKPNGTFKEVLFTFEESISLFGLNLRTDKIERPLLGEVV